MYGVRQGAAGHVDATTTNDNDNDDNVTFGLLVASANLATPKNR